MRTYLSGMPECKLGLNDRLLLEPQGGTRGKTIDLDDIRFHQCVRLARFESDRTISFIPPDGSFDLMTYRLSTQVKPLIWVEAIIEKHARSRVEMLIKARSQFKERCVSVFGVSAESMQLSYDPRGNSVPTILLLMQERLYAQGGLKAEGIFRINADNSKEEEVRDQLNRGNVPEDIEVHCLAGLIKAWFRELPCGVLDGLSPDEVLQCNTEEECSELVKHLKPTETALLNWAVDLMSDVVFHELFQEAFFYLT